MMLPRAAPRAIGRAPPVGGAKRCGGTCLLLVAADEARGEFEPGQAGARRSFIAQLCRTAQRVGSRAAEATPHGGAPDGPPNGRRLQRVAGRLADSHCASFGDTVGSGRNGCYVSVGVGGKVGGVVSASVPMSLASMTVPCCVGVGVCLSG